MVLHLVRNSRDQLHSAAFADSGLIGADLRVHGAGENRVLAAQQGRQRKQSSQRRQSPDHRPELPSAKPPHTPTMLLLRGWECHPVRAWPESLLYWFSVTQAAATTGASGALESPKCPREHYNRIIESAPRSTDFAPGWKPRTAGQCWRGG